MSYSVKTVPSFDSEIKKLVKKYSSLKEEFIELVNQLINNPTLGIPLGNHCYKLRLSIKSKGKGKSGGARIVTHFYVEESTVYLLTIYDKSAKENISIKDIDELIKQID